MNNTEIIKILLIVSFILMESFSAWLKYLDNSYIKRELPDNVKDVYDEKEYKRWLSYNKECGRVDIIETVVLDVIMLIMLAFNIYAMIFSVFEGVNMYLQYLLVIAIYSALELLVAVPFSYHNIFVIEEKYGMNKSTKKTFVLDQVKDLITNTILTCVLIFIIMFFYERFGNRGLIWATAVYVILSLLLGIVIMPIMRLYNKFDPLEDGELKAELLSLCEKYGVKVKKICVKDASRRTTKANAFCTGFGKRKVISLDDNLVNQYTTEQIVAVFAHEFAHAKYKHMIKSMPFSVGRMVILMAALGVVLNVPSIYDAFGFTGMNYFFAFLVLNFVSWPVDRIMDLVGNYLSRKHEYEADAFAAKEGYGNGLVSSLKKLHKDSLTDLNPHPIVVKLTFSHPTLSQRITAIEQIGD